MKTYEASTHVGFSEYHGKQHLYDGNFEETARGTVAEVVAYLEGLEAKIEAGMDSDGGLKWDGANGTWYSGSEAVKAINLEVSSLLDGSHPSLNMEVLS